MGEQSSTRQHIPALDGLRALAVIAVVLCHVNWAFGGPFVVGRVNGPVAALFGAGWVGVDLFFVLSGFLITGILFEARGCRGFFRNFYARRALRIMPLYFAFLFVTLALPFAFWRRPALSEADVTSLALYFYNFRVAYTGQALSYFHPFWSLAVEEHFYLLWPLAVWALPRRPLMRLCLIGAAVSLALRVAVVLGTGRPEAGFFLTPCRLDALLAGSFVALARRDQADWERLGRRAGRLVLGAGLLLLGVALGQRHFIPDTGGDPLAAVDGKLVVTVGLTVLAVFFAGLLVLAVRAAEGGRLRRLLENRALTAVGKYSYAIYVFHSLILVATVSLFPSLSRLPVFVAKPLTAVWVLAASFAAAWLSYHLFEKHFLRLKRFFECPAAAPAGAFVPARGPAYSHA